MDMLSLSDTTHAFIDAERCIAELQRGRAIVLTDDSASRQQAGSTAYIAILLESLHEQALSALTASENCQLVLSRSRAVALGLMVDSSVVCIDLASDTAAQTVRHWAGLTPCSSADAHDLSRGVGGISLPEAPDTRVEPANHSLRQTKSANALLNLARHAHVLPAFIMYATHARPEQLLSVSTQTALGYQDQSGNLMKLSSASIPLSIANKVELTVFREKHGHAEHVAITVGTPDFSKPVTVRIHSSCFTGDILGSLKCDCGEQLQSAIREMANNEGGVVLYIAQEGRGIGLASKLLAYQLQDLGLDTIDANQHLGFSADERTYQSAVFMLEQLGISRVMLMTNNPLKIAALKEQGVDVLSRIPSPATVNSHNERYLQTKRDRAGHLAGFDITTG